MRKLVLAVMIVSVCAGCQTSTEVQYADQATDRAVYLRAHAAGLQKQAQEAERVIASLREQMERERRYMTLYQQEAAAAAERLKRLERDRGATEAEQMALERMKEVLRGRRAGLLLMVETQQDMIAHIREQIAIQQSCRGELLKDAQATLKESEELERRASELASQ